jgi:2,4-didehydro-3-deoxy-L-rhamnonate hydrolase
VTPIVGKLPPLTWPLPLGDQLIRHFASLRSEIERLADAAPVGKVSDVELLSPVANPGKIIGAPVNYAEHAAEASNDQTLSHGRPIRGLLEAGLFLKASSALVGPSEGVQQRFPERRNDYEAELVVVIGKTGTRISRAEAMDYVLGYAVGLDMTIRGPEFPCLRKSVDSYAVVGPWLVTKDEVADVGRLELNLWVNGERRQHANTKDLISDIPTLIAYASSFYTLYPGDLLMTGTPSGVGPVHPGDRIEVEVEAVGRMAVQVQ